MVQPNLLIEHPSPKIDEHLSPKVVEVEMEVSEDKMESEGRSEVTTPHKEIVLQSNFNAPKKSMISCRPVVKLHLNGFLKRNRSLLTRWNGGKKNFCHP